MSLYHLFSQVESEEHFQELLDITCTEKEQTMMEERWRILNALNEGKSQRAIAKELACSVVTVTRGAKVYRTKKAIIKKWLTHLLPA